MAGKAGKEKAPPKESRFRTPLNVVVEKIGATKALVHGDLSKESLKELLMSSLSLIPGITLAQQKGMKDLTPEQQQALAGKSTAEALAARAAAGVLTTELREKLKKGEKEETMGKGKQGEGKKEEGKQGEVKKEEGKQGEGKKEEWKQGEGKKGEGKQEEGKKGEGKKSEGKKIEGKKGEGKKGEGKKGGEKKVEGKKGAQKTGKGKRKGKGIEGKGKEVKGKRGKGRRGKARIEYVEDYGEYDFGDYGEEEVEEEEEEEVTVEEESLPSCVSSDTEGLRLSYDGKWLRRYFKKPLILGLRDIVAKKPYDPVGYLAFWLLEYRKSQEKAQWRQEVDEELLALRNDMPQPMPEMEEEHLSGGEEEGGGYADWNFKNYDARPHGEVQT